MARHRLAATPETCFWGFFDPELEPVLAVDPGDVVDVETLTHHAGDAPDLLMDDGVWAIWDAIAPDQRGPGPHVMTGPIEVRGAQPGDTVTVEILALEPRVPYGSNCAAHWGLLYDTFAKERITIYELAEGGETASPAFAFDFTGRPLYDEPGFVSEPASVDREPFSRAVRVPVRPHLGVIGVAPSQAGKVSSVPPGVFGGNVDNWRFGAGAIIHYPVFAPGARVFFGDPHLSQGDGEICGTAIEASMHARVRLSLSSDLSVTAPVLDTGAEWFTHGFDEDLDKAMRMAAEQMLGLLGDRYGVSPDEAYSLASVAVDLGVTQVVDSTLGCHAALRKDLFTG